jgi:hypothetical protein
MCLKVREKSDSFYIENFMNMKVVLIVMITNIFIETLKNDHEARELFKKSYSKKLFLKNHNGS